MILSSCGGDVITGLNTTKIYGSWKFDSMSVDKTMLRDTFKSCTFSFESTGKLSIKNNDSIINVPCYIFHSPYSNYVVVTQIVDSTFLFVNKKWLIGSISPSNLRLDYNEIDKNTNITMFLSR